MGYKTTTKSPKRPDTKENNGKRIQSWEEDKEVRETMQAVGRGRWKVDVIIFNHLHYKLLKVKTKF